MDLFRHNFPVRRFLKLLLLRIALLNLLRYLCRYPRYLIAFVYALKIYFFGEKCFSLCLEEHRVCRLEHRTFWNVPEFGDILTKLSQNIQ